MYIHSWQDTCPFWLRRIFQMHIGNTIRIADSVLNLAKDADASVRPHQRLTFESGELELVASLNHMFCWCLGNSSRYYSRPLPVIAWFLTHLTMKARSTIMSCHLTTLCSVPAYNRCIYICYMMSQDIYIYCMIFTCIVWYLKYIYIYIHSTSYNITCKQIQ